MAMFVKFDENLSTLLMGDICINALPRFPDRTQKKD